MNLALAGFVDKTVPLLERTTGVRMLEAAIATMRVTTVMSIGRRR